jgi:ubiquitin carboxyl-terminal hydrolase 25
MTGTQHTPFQTALTVAANVLDMHKDVLDEVDHGLIDFMRDEKTLIDKELQDITIKLMGLKEELEGLWKDHQQVAYELTSVFIHRGSSIDWGHYFFYSRHLPEQPNSWFKYNDSEVVEVSKDEVFADTTGGTANPYLVRALPYL